MYLDELPLSYNHLIVFLLYDNKALVYSSIHTFCDTRVFLYRKEAIKLKKEGRVNRMTNKIIGYIRTSTSSQDLGLEVQKKALERYKPILFILKKLVVGKKSEYSLKKR